MTQFNTWATLEEILREIGGRLQRKRLARNWRAADLATHTGLSRRTIAALEAGDDVKFSTVIRVMRSLRTLPNLEAAFTDELPVITPRMVVRQRVRARRRPPAAS